MKVFSTADIHGNRKIVDKLTNMADMADLIIVCGDIGGKDIKGKTLQQFSEYQAKDADYLCKVLNSISIPCKFILGNDDWFEIEDDNYLKESVKIGGLQLIPFEYVLITPFNTNREVNENKLNYELHRLRADTGSVIVAHTPPHLSGDILYSGERCGSKAVRNWIEEVQPMIWLNGHIHEDNSVSRIGNTMVFNCACYYTDNKLKGWLIDTATLDFEAVEI